VARYDPSRDLGPLFHDVQMSGIFADSKTFVDARPLRLPAEIVSLYADARNSVTFDLRKFVEQYFELPQLVAGDFRADTARSKRSGPSSLVKRTPRTRSGRSSRCRTRT